MKSIFRIIKVCVSMIFIATAISQMIGMLGVSNTLYPTFGHGIIVSVSLFLITLTKGGKLYFTALFRSMIVFCFIIEVIEQVDIYVNMTTEHYYNLIAGAFGISLLLYVWSRLRWQKKN